MIRYSIAACLLAAGVYFFWAAAKHWHLSHGEGDGGLGDGILAIVSFVAGMVTGGGGLGIIVCTTRSLMLACGLLLMVAAPTWADPNSYALPDNALTPGVVDPTCTIDTLKTNDTTTRRTATDALKEKIYAKYGIHQVGTIPVTQANGKVVAKKVYDGICAGPHGCEVDDRISLEVCGKNAEANLWIQPYDGPCNAHDKDRLENQSKADIIAGTITIAEAQRRLGADDWTVEYQKRFGKSCMR